MEKKIALISATPEIIDAILILADVVSKLKKTNETEGGRSKMNNSKKTELSEAISVAKKTESQGQALVEVTFTMLWERLIELARDGRQECIRALLGRYGVRKLTELPKEKYNEVFMEVEKW